MNKNDTEFYKKRDKIFSWLLPTIIVVLFFVVFAFGYLTATNKM
jgi:hypothetical protein